MKQLLIAVVTSILLSACATTDVPRTAQTPSGQAEIEVPVKDLDRIKATWMAAFVTMPGAIIESDTGTQLVVTIPNTDIMTGALMGNRYSNQYDVARIMFVRTQTGYRMIMTTSLRVAFPFGKTEEHAYTNNEAFNSNMKALRAVKLTLERQS